MNIWHKVKDGQPPNPGQYQVYYDFEIKGDRYGVGYYVPVKKLNLDNVQTDKVETEMQWKCMYSAPPTHWAYPPEPPTK